MQNSPFLAAFAKAANLAPRDADDQWAVWSRQLSDAERQQIEDGGEESGRAEGEIFYAAYRELLDAEFPRP